MAYDVIVIGAGPGGYIAAIQAAKRGFKTLCIEKSKTLGGTCLNVGCIPSKALLQSSEHYQFEKLKAKEHGIMIDKIVLDFPAMQERKEGVVKGLVQSVENLFKQFKVDSIFGHASFETAHSIRVGDKVFEAKYVILATGSEPVELSNLQFDNKRIVSSTGALFLKEPPKKMVVVGAGVIGVELASVYSRLGTKVEIFEMLDRICPQMDRAVSRELLRILTKQGLEFHLKTKVEPDRIDADVVLVAVGRRPYTKGLGLEKVGITLDKSGFIPVNDNYETAVTGVFAIGDIVEGPMLAHRASEEGIAVVDHLAGIKSEVNLLAIPNVIYTMPEVAAVGMTEEEAREAGLDVAAGVSYMKGNARARASGETEGFAKVLSDRKSKKVIGVHLIAEHASEMIGEGVAVVSVGMEIGELARMSHAHPTLSEAIKEAAQNLKN